MLYLVIYVAVGLILGTLAFHTVLADGPLPSLTEAVHAWRLRRKALRGEASDIDRAWLAKHARPRPSRSSEPIERLRKTAVLGALWPLLPPIIVCAVVLALCLGIFWATGVLTFTVTDEGVDGR